MTDGNPGASERTTAQGVSVVVPVHNAAATLATCVEAVIALDDPGVESEAVFVDNGSTDESRDILRSYEPRIRVVSERRRGPSAARNAGVRATLSDLLAFTDADCVPEPQWLAELVAAARAYPDASIIGGPILAWRPATFAARFSERMFDQERAVGATRLPYVISANLCTRRDVLDAVGGFDETLRTGEDVDLSYRVNAACPGRLVFAGRAVVRHVNPDTLAKIWQKGLEHGRTVGRLAERHAEIRGETAVDRLLSARRYTRIAKRLAAFAAGGVRHLATGGSTPDDEWLDPLFDAAFNGAKQVGVAAHLLSTIVPGSSDE